MLEARERALRKRSTELLMRIPDNMERWGLNQLEAANAEFDKLERDYRVYLGLRLVVTVLPWVLGVVGMVGLFFLLRPLLM